MAACAAQDLATRATRAPVPSDEPILASKIAAPGVPDWAIQRPRISKLITRGTRRCPLTVVTGPPGAGKTLALVLWTAAEAGPVAWVCLDEYDNRPGVFWSYVVAALRRSGVAVPRALPAAAGGADGQVFLLRLASVLAVQDPPVTLVLDDLHLLTDPPALDGLYYLLRNAGRGLRLVICSRMNPLLPLHRYRLAGELAEIRASDLAFSTAEAGLLMTRHGITLSAGSLEQLTRRTEGWAAGIRLAAISMDGHPRPDQVVEEMLAEDSAVAGYLVEEVLNAQPPEAREVLLNTSILERVSAEGAAELAGNQQAAATLRDLAHANAFVQPIGRGWYRYHPCFAEVLRIKLRCQHPGRMASLHQRAARWCERNGLLIEGVRHAAEAGDWPLASSMVIDELAISEIIEPRGSQPLAGEFWNMPQSEPWTDPQPYLVSAAVALSAGGYETCVTALDAAEGILERLPADWQAACRLAAAVIRLVASLRTGDLIAAAAAVHAEVLVSRAMGDKLARHPELRARVLRDRGVVELWSGHLDEAADVLDSGVAAATASGGDYERTDCLGHLALVEALRGHLRRAAELAVQATSRPAERRPPAQHPNSAALAALAWVHLEHNDLREARSQLKRLNAALGACPDKPIGAVACLAAAYSELAAGRAAAAARLVARGRCGWSVPAWLDQRMSLAESRAYAASGDIQASLTAAQRAGHDNSPEAAVAVAQAWLAAGDSTTASRVLAPAMAAGSAASERVRLQACLVDARLSYDSSDQARGRRSLASALRLAKREQTRLPFVLERRWLGPILRQDPGLADSHRRLFAQPPCHDQLPAPPRVQNPAMIRPTEPLSDREREVLRHFSGMLDTAEVANEMYLSVNTVKTHLKHIYRKLAVTHRGEAVRRARQLELI
jgi:LuxR family transcriptional regulator, maltose regulon positive regulatory protein